METAYVACRRLKVNGVEFVPGDSITSAQIGAVRLERVLESQGRIKPQPKPAPEPAEEQVPLISALADPPRNKGGRPRTRPA